MSYSFKGMRERIESDESRLAALAGFEEDLASIEENLEQVKQMLPNDTESLRDHIEDCFQHVFNMTSQAEASDDGSMIINDAKKKLDLESFQRQPQMLIEMLEVLLYQARFIYQQSQTMTQALADQQSLAAQLKSQLQQTQEEFQSLEERSRQVARELERTDQALKAAQKQQDDTLQELLIAKKECTHLRETAMSLNNQLKDSANTRAEDELIWDKKVQAIRSDSEQALKTLQAEVEALNEALQDSEEISTRAKTSEAQMKELLQSIQQQKDFDDMEFTRQIDAKNIQIQNLDKLLLQREMDIQNQQEELRKLRQAQAMLESPERYMSARKELPNNSPSIELREATLETTPKRTFDKLEIELSSAKKRRVSLGQAPQIHYSINSQHSRANMVEKEVQTNDIEMQQEEMYHQMEYYQDLYDQFERSREQNGHAEGTDSFIGQDNSGNVFVGLQTAQYSQSVLVPSTQTEQLVQAEPAANADSATKSLQDNPEEEYFRLLVLSIKILHSERDPEFGVELNSSKIFKQVKREKIPFHKWFFWVDKRVTEAAKQQKQEVTVQKQREHDLVNAAAAAVAAQAMQTATPGKSGGLMSRLKNMFTSSNQQAAASGSSRKPAKDQKDKKRAERTSSQAPVGREMPQLTLQQANKQKAEQQPSSSKLRIGQHQGNNSNGVKMLNEDDDDMIVSMPPLPALQQSTSGSHHGRSASTATSRQPYMLMQQQYS